MLTPAMQQYAQIKSNYQDHIVLFRMGDFYESFYDDAKQLAEILDIVLTSRDKEKKIPMAGIPFHSIDSYLEKLIQANKKVVLVEQLENPQKGGKIVKRGIVRIFTPSTTFFDNEISKENNYLFAITKIGTTFDCSFCDIKEGKIYHVVFEKKIDLMNNMLLINPREVILPINLFLPTEINQMQDLLPTALINAVNQEIFSNNRFLQYINENLKLDLIDKKENSIKGILNYLVDTQLTKLEHITEVVEFKFNDYMQISIDVLRGLEIFEGQREESIPLIKILDYTCTPGGARLLRDWLKKPLVSKKLIIERQQKVRSFVEFGIEFITNMMNLLTGVSDIYKLSTKIGLKNANPRDLRNLCSSYDRILLFVQSIHENEVLHNVFNYELSELIKNTKNTEGIIKKISSYIVEDPPISVRDGGLIKKGVSKELDELYEIKQTGKNWMKSFEINEIRRTGINTLKVKFNKIFGFYIEVSKGNIHKVPPNYIRKQTLVNAERYITPELKEYEAKALNAEEQIKHIEYKIFSDLLNELSKYVSSFQKIALFISEFDVYISLAYVAINNNWTCPEISEDFYIDIKNGYHPVVEHALKKSGRLFVKNSYFADELSSLQIITGPNMGGKSTFLRQIGLIVYLAQIGSFVSADYASIGIVDNIFTRIGASDNIAKGESTFMVEMQEMAKIINLCTQKSLVLLDEVGRGTSTFDGMSLAWAICEYLAHKGVKTLFATHYHELTELGEKFNNVKNLFVKVSEFNGDIIFLHQVINGKSDKSYGIHVAKLAGMPESITQRAQKILSVLEKKQITTKKVDLFSIINPNTDKDDVDVDYDEIYQEIIEILKYIDVNKLSPVEAFNIILKLKEKLKDY